MDIPKISKIKLVWVAWTNTDLTEGRGRVIPFVVCESKVTAERLGRGMSVQGSDCHITQEIAVKIGSKWLGPCNIEVSSNEDDKEIKRRDLHRAIIKKAKDLGLSDSEIALLCK